MGSGAGRWKSEPATARLYARRTVLRSPGLRASMYVLRAPSGESRPVCAARLGRVKTGTSSSESRMGRLSIGSRLTDRAQAAGDSPAGARVVDDSPCPLGHNTPLPLKRSAPASFKRLLGGNLARRSHQSAPAHDSERRRVESVDHGPRVEDVANHPSEAHRNYDPREAPAQADPRQWPILRAAGA